MSSLKFRIFRNFRFLIFSVCCILKLSLDDTQIGTLRTHREERTLQLHHHQCRRDCLSVKILLYRAAAAVLFLFCLCEAGHFFAALFSLWQPGRRLPACLCATAAAAEPAAPPVTRNPFVLAVPEAFLPGGTGESIPRDRDNSQPGNGLPVPFPGASSLPPGNPYGTSSFSGPPAAGNRTTGPDCLAVLPMDYLDAGDLLRSLKELRLSGRLSVSSARNALLYAGPASERDRIRALIHRLDVPGRQVTLQATILAVNRSAERDLGIHWTWDTLPQYEKSSGGTTSDTNETYAGHFRLWPSSSAQFHFNAALHALLTTGKARVLATPSLITLPGKEASIFIGSHIPVVTEKRSDGESNYATEYVDAGIKLTYLPFVGRDGLITSQVHTEVSTPVLVSELKNYRINSRTADTTVRLKNGETLAIGGLVSEEEQRQLQQIPLLSKIPVLGELFKYRFRSKTKTEVIILLTPYLTDAGQSPAIYNPSLQDNASGPSRKADS